MESLCIKTICEAIFWEPGIGAMDFSLKHVVLVSGDISDVGSDVVSILWPLYK